MKIMPEENDVQKVEKTTTFSSDEKQTEIAESQDAEGEVVTQDVKKEEQKTVPYERFKEVNDKYKELLDSNKPTEREIQNQAADLSQATGESYEDALKIVREEAEKAADRKILELTRKMDLDRVIDKNPDFYNYADQVKDLVKGNPGMTFENALKIARFDSGQVQKHDKQVDQKARVESASKSKSAPGPSESIDPLAKGPDGKFLYSTKEIEELLS